MNTSRESAAGVEAGGRRSLFRPSDGFFVIAGPCVVEDDDLNLRVAEELTRVATDLRVPILYKASFDKANRSRTDAPRGPGLHAGLERLARVRAETGLPIVTDIHESHQAVTVAEICDVLQIPAALCRQTDLVTAAGSTGRHVNVKKAQWLAPEDLRHAVAKALAAGAADVAVTERGTFFGYGDLVVDMRSFTRLRDATGVPVVFDGTHSVQRPGARDGASGGDPRFTPDLVRAAVAAGADALFLEVHPDPARAPSDGSNMLKLERFRPLLERVLAIRAALAAEIENPEDTPRA